MNRRLRFYLVLMLAFVTRGAGAQTQEVIPSPALGVRLTASALGDLPSGGNLFVLLDTVIPEVISDRIDTGGLSVGSPARIGAHGSSWRQPLFRLDGVDITDGDGSGAPLFLPGVIMWDYVDVSTGLLPIDVNAPGLAVSLAPRRPGATWTRLVEGLATGRGLVSRANPDPGEAPAIGRLRSAANASVLLSGPLVPNRVGLVLAGTLNASTRFERADPTELGGDQESLFTHLVYTPRDRHELRVVGWLQRASAPFENRVALDQPRARERRMGGHGQLVWERRTGDSRLWSAFASYGVRQRALEGLPRNPSIVIDRVTDGPVEALLYPGPSTNTNWSVGVRLNPANGSAGPALRGMQQNTPGPTAGVEISGTGVRMQPAFTGRVGETINGLPARIWEFSETGVASQWNQTTIAAYAGHLLQPHRRVTVDAGVRFERLTGSAEGANGVSWNDWLPRAGVRWHLTDVGHIAALAGYSRTAHRLALTDLAWSDPSAPTGSVYRWNATGSALHAPLPSERGALVARLGPGAGSLAGFSTIDPDLRRPHMDELTFGFEGRPLPSTIFRLVGMGRRERDLIGVVNTGVPESAYSVSRIFDPGLFGDGQMLPVYNRPVALFGADRYLLTNPGDHETTFVGAELTGQRQTERLFLLFGLTAGRSEGLSANRGFRAIENDAALLGEVFTNPNARTFAQGRLFTERGYTIKLSLAYRFAHDIRFGMAARYQDGEHFARLVIVPNLNQGPEIVRAFRNGRTRFTMTPTLDARLQKGFTIGSRRVAAVIEGFSLLNHAWEIEEFQVSGALSRTTTAVQPPRALHAGVRIEF